MCVGVGVGVRVWGGCSLISSLRSLPVLHLAGLFGTYRAFCGRRAWSSSRVVWVVARARPFQDGAAVVCLDQKQQRRRSRVRRRRDLCWGERGGGARVGPWAEQEGMMGKLEMLLEFTHLSAVIVTASSAPFKACQLPLDQIQYARTQCGHMSLLHDNVFRLHRDSPARYREPVFLSPMFR